MPTYHVKFKGKQYDVPWDKPTPPTKMDFADFIDKQNAPPSLMDKVGDVASRYGQGLKDVGSGIADTFTDMNTRIGAASKKGIGASLSEIAKPMLSPAIQMTKLAAQSQEEKDKNREQNVGEVIGLAGGPGKSTVDAYKKGDYARLGGQASGLALMFGAGHLAGRFGASRGSVVEHPSGDGPSGGSPSAAIPDVAAPPVEFIPPKQLTSRLRDINAEPGATRFAGASPLDPNVPIDGEVVGQGRLPGQTLAQRSLPPINDRGLPPARPIYEMGPSTPERQFQGGPGLTAPNRSIRNWSDARAQMARPPQGLAEVTGPPVVKPPVATDILPQNSPYGMNYLRRDQAPMTPGRAVPLGDVAPIEASPLQTPIEAPKIDAMKVKPKGVEDVSKRPYLKLSDKDLESVLKTGDKTALAEAKKRPSFVEWLKANIKSEKGSIDIPGMLGMDEAGSKNFRKVYDDIATSGLTVIKNLGGQDLHDMILRNRLDAEQLAGRFNNHLKSITKGLSKEELANYIEVRDTGAAPISDKVQAAFEQFKTTDADLTDIAKRSGMGLKTGKKVVPFKEMDNYFAHIYPPEFFKDKPNAMAKLMAEGKTQAEAEQILKKASEHGERLIDPQHARVVNAPGYRKDINVDYQHVNDMTRRAMQAKDFGNMDTADPKSPISRAIDATTDPKRVRDIVEKYLGRSEPMDPAWAKANNAVVGFQAATKLSKFLINNTAQIGMVPVRAGFKNAGKALGRTLFDYSGAKSEAEISGALQPVYHEVVKEIGKKGLSSYYGIQQGETFNRTVSAIAGKYTVKEVYKTLQKNPKNAKARAQLADLTLENPDKLLAQGSLTDWQINRAMARFSEVTQGRAGNIDLPAAWSEHPAARMLMLYKRYAFTQSKNIKDAIKIMGPAKTATVIAAMSAVMGEGIGDINATIKGTGRAMIKGNLEEEIKKAIEARGAGLDRIVNNLAQSWALGYVGDLLDSSGRGTGGIVTNLAGPVVGDADEAGTDVGSLVKKTGKWLADSPAIGHKQAKRPTAEDLRPLAAMGARMVPLFGSGLASAIRERKKANPNAF